MANGGERWSGRVGFVLATIGSAIGIGSIWKFPYEVGENGGAGFVFFYVLGLLLVVVPLLLAEFLIGRRGQGDAAYSIAKLAEESGGGRRWGWAGWLAILTGFLILTYYAVIGGMMIAYAVISLLRGYAGTDGPQAAAVFEGLAASPLALAFYQAVFLAASVFIVARGIGRGVEVACKFLMPLLAALMLLLVAYALVEGAVGEALAFLFAPSLKGFTPRAALEALGLGFFSIGVGMGLMITYAAYAGKEMNLTTAALATVIGDTAISILAGLAIFPLVFGAGLDPAAGVSLMFLTLPIAFGQLPLGDWVAFAFFLLLFVAALASAISLLELTTAPLRRITGKARAGVVSALGVVCWLLGLPTVLSFNLWSEARPLSFLPVFSDFGIFELIDGLASNLMLPVGGLLIAAFAGWRIRRSVVAEELGWRAGGIRLLAVLLRWVAPALILASLLAGHLLG